MATLIWEARKCESGFRKKKPRAEAPYPETAEAGEQADWEAKLEAAINALNLTYFVAGLGGRAAVCRLAADDQLGRERLVFSREADMRLMFAHQHYIVAISQRGNEVWKGLGDAWLDHAQRRTYDRVALIPDGPCPPNVFNLWCGFGVAPQAGRWPTLEAHLREVICAGNDEHYRWLLGWLAYCMQHPGRQAEVAVVLHDLLRLDLEGWNHRAAPHMAAFDQQKLISAESFVRFWYGCLEAGFLLNTGEADWPASVVCQVLHAGYIEHAHQHGDRHPLTINQLGVRLRALSPRYFRIGRPREPWNGIERPSRYMLGSLEQHRVAFLLEMKIDPSGHQWPEES